MNIKRTIPVLVLFVLVSCNMKKDHNVMCLSLPAAIKVESIVYDKEAIIGIPSQLEIINDQLFLFCSRGCVAQILSTGQGEQIGCFGQMGQGPYEHISPFFSGYDSVNKNLYIWDVSLNAMSCYHSGGDNDTILFTPIHRIKKDEKGQSLYFEAHYMTNDKYVAVVALGEDISSYFLMLNKDLEEVKRFGNVPFLADLEGMDIRRLNGSMVSSDTQFIFAAMSYGYIVCYDMSAKNEISKKWEYYLSEPHYKTKKGEIVFDDNNKMGFYDVKMNSKYIFALYHGNELSHMIETGSTPKSLLVFDLEGKLINLFELDRQCVRIAVTDDNIIFAASVEFDSEIVRYDLTEYL